MTNSEALIASYPRINPETGKSGRTPKEFCIYGHEIAVVGRKSSGGLCRECSREKTRTRAHQRTKERREKVNVHKLALGCARCGYKTCASALHFHHVGDKAFNVASRVKALSWENLLPEIEKCTVLCANCHAELSWG